MRTAFGQLGASGALMVLLVGYLMVRQPMLEHDVKDSRRAVSSQQQEINALTKQSEAFTAGLSEANRRLVALGKTPVPTPTVAPPAPVVQPEGLTAEQSAAVRLIVADQLSQQKVTITQAEISQIARVAALLVPKPADGKTPSAAQIQPVVTAAIAAYCTGDKCVGKQGAEGPQGERGADGRDAPKVTDEELLKASAQALAAYCGQESSPCDGKVGPSGTDGADAPVMVDIDCKGDGEASYWRMQFNKGPDKTAMGPCRLGPEPPE